jgi:hypothetical protein
MREHRYGEHQRKHNYVPHVKIPLGGRHDYVMPLEESQTPLYRRALTPTPSPPSPPLTPRNDDDIVV